MHRSYQPLKPTPNRFLQRRWDQTRYQDHRDKVKEATPVVDTKGSETPFHIKHKLKRVQMQEERLALIDRDNHLLSSRLEAIGLSHGLLDHRNPYHESSLNAEKRHQWLLQISQENQGIYDRISSQKSHYRRDVWEEHWERASRRRDDIARYPRGTQNREKSVNFSAEGRSRSSAVEDQSVPEKYSKTHTM